MKRNIHWLLVESDLGARSFGAMLGPKAVKLTALNHSSEIFTEQLETVLSTEIDNADFNNPFCKHIDDLILINERTSSVIQEITQEGNFPFILSGDHSNQIGIFSGVHAAYPDEKVGIIWIDAHGDLHTPYTSPSGNAHGMPLGCLLNLERNKKGINEPITETKEKWEKLCQIGGTSPKLTANDIVFIGIRDLEQKEWDLIHEENIKYFAPDAINQLGVDELVEQTLKHLQHCDKIVLTFDTDSLDSRIVPGTGTPVRSGMSVSYAQALLKLLWNHDKLAAIDFTEVNPILDIKNQTSETIFELISQLLSTE